MAEKRYYWLKLKSDFFTQPKIKKLRKMAGGDTFTIIYLKMKLLTLNTGGQLVFEEIEDDFISELALKLDEDEDNVQLTVSYLQSKGLLELVNADEYLLPEVKNITGSEAASTIRSRKSRENKKNLPVFETKALQCNTDATKCNIDIDIEKEKEKDIEKEKKKNKKEKPVRHKYGEYENVLLSDEDMNKLQNEFPTDYQERIERLSCYMASTGKSYKNHLATIRNWAKRDTVTVKTAKQETKWQDNDIPADFFMGGVE